MSIAHQSESSCTQRRPRRANVFSVVERLGQHRPRLGEERGIGERGLLLGEQQGVLQGDRRLRGEELQGDEPIGREGAGEEVVFEIEQADHLGLPQDGQAQDRLGPVRREVVVVGELARVGWRRRSG